MIITFTGQNSYAATQAERQVVQAFVQKHGQHGLERVDAETLIADYLPTLLQGANLFAPARLVVIKNISANKSIQEPLLDALNLTPSDITVVIADSALDKRTKLYKFLQKTGTFKDFAPLSDSQLIKWLQDQAKDAGVNLGAAESAYLVQRAGHDQWRLANDLQKLVNYTDTITKQDIDTLVDPDPQGSAFDLLDAALGGKHAQVAQLVAALKVKQEDPYKMFGLIASQVHTLAVVAAAGSRSPDVIAKDAGLHPFAVRKAQSAARRIGQNGVAHMARRVADCDAKLKSSGADPWDLLALCLQKIARS